MQAFGCHALRLLHACRCALAVAFVFGPDGSNRSDLHGLLLCLFNGRRTWFVDTVFESTCSKCWRMFQRCDMFLLKAKPAMKGCGLGVKAGKAASEILRRERERVCGHVRLQAR